MLILLFKKEQKNVTDKDATFWNSDFNSFYFKENSKKNESYNQTQTKTQEKKNTDRFMSLFFLLVETVEYYFTYKYINMTYY